MCFSANASFAASAVIGTIGIIAVTKTKTVPQVLFAIIPLIFSFQQLSEGLLWLSLKQPGLKTWQPAFTYTFLVFAMAIWPLWIPLTALLLEKIKKRKKTLILLAALGIIGSVSGVCLMLLFPVRAIPDHHHLHYHFDLSQSTKGLAWLFTILYLLATVVSLFISSLKRMKWLGIVFLVTYLVTLLVFPGFVVSAWCYFAAILSIVVLWILMGLTKTENG